MVNESNCNFVQHELNVRQEFPGGDLPNGTKFLTSCSDYRSPITEDYIFYSKGREIYYADMRNKTYRNLISFDNNVTAFIYYANDIKFNRLYVALENGDFCEVDISSILEPKIIAESKFNVGGKIVDLLELAYNSYEDYYK